MTKIPGRIASKLLFHSTRRIYILDLNHDGIKLVCDTTLCEGTVSALHVQVSASLRRACHRALNVPADKSSLLSGP
jgi:hypothetical protein